MAVPEFKHISKHNLDAVVISFLAALHKSALLQCPDLNETADAIEYVGGMVRTEAFARSLKGHAIFAKQILEVATTR